MACRHLRFDPAAFAAEEWVPMALREATCMLRRSNPEKWNQVLRCQGHEVEGDDVHCLHNLEGTYHVCPLFRDRQAASASRPAPEPVDPQSEADEDDVPRNEHGYPLRL